MVSKEDDEKNQPTRPDSPSLSLPPVGIQADMVRIMAATSRRHSLGLVQLWGATQAPRTSVQIGLSRHIIFRLPFSAGLGKQLRNSWLLFFSLGSAIQLPF